MNLPEYCGTIVYDVRTSHSTDPAYDLASIGNMSVDGTTINFINTNTYPAGVLTVSVDVRYDDDAAVAYTFDFTITIADCLTSTITTVNAASIGVKAYRFGSNFSEVIDASGESFVFDDPLIATRCMSSIVAYRVTCTDEAGNTSSSVPCSAF